MKKILIFIGFSLSLFFTNSAISETQVSSITHSINTPNFINKMVEHYRFNREELKQLFEQVIFQPKVLASIQKPSESISWYRYRRIFMTAQRIQHAKEYTQKYKSVLDAVSQQYGVPAAVIVGIIGVETDYGQHVGNYRVIDALSTLAFHYPPREKFFQSELVAYLLMTREQHLDPLTLKGSYAGAIGLPQFMPSSYREYAVDYDGAEGANLQTDNVDAIASIGNYLAKKGWHRGEDIVVPVSLRDQTAMAYITKSLKPEHSIAFWQQHGVKLPTDAHLDSTAKAILVKLAQADGQYSYWLGLHNFYVITRYNPSPLYAMAVVELGNASVVG